MSPHDLLIVVFLIGFLLCELLASWPIPSRVNLTSLGLACLAVALLLTRF